MLWPSSAWQTTSFSLSLSEQWHLGEERPASWYSSSLKKKKKRAGPGGEAHLFYHVEDFLKMHLLGPSPENEIWPLGDGKETLGGLEGGANTHFEKCFRKLSSIFYTRPLCHFWVTATDVIHPCHFIDEETMAQRGKGIDLFQAIQLVIEEPGRDSRTLES